MCSIKCKQVGLIDSNISILEYELKSEKICIRCLNYGATILSILHEINGEREEITLNYRSFEELYHNRIDVPYYGCIVGRVANRTCKGIFSINNKKYSLAINNGENHLHGGIVGYDKVVWNSSILENDDSVGVCFRYLSKDGEEGYPGNIDIRVIYKLTLDEKFSIEYFATTDSSTPINLTNHTYWNLSGNVKTQFPSEPIFQSNISDHRLYLNCDHYLPVDSHQIPTEILSPVFDTHFDFTTSVVTDPRPDSGGIGKRIGDVILEIDGGGMPGLDHCFVTNTTSSQKCIASSISRSVDDTPISTSDENSIQVPFVATLVHNNRMMDIYSTQPGVQVYTANWLPMNSNLNSNTIHCQHNAICLECQHFPNAINFKNLPVSHYSHATSVEKLGVLLPDEQFYHQTVHVFR